MLHPYLFMLYFGMSTSLSSRAMFIPVIVPAASENHPSHSKGYPSAARISSANSSSSGCFVAVSPCSTE